MQINQHAVAVTSTLNPASSRSRDGNVWKLVLTVFFFAALSHPTHAQRYAGEANGTDTPRWIGHLTVLAINSLIGALTGGVAQRLRGGSFENGFAWGAGGGAVVYVGKRIAGERFWGAGLAGREIASVGSSMVRNASEGRPVLSRVLMQVGPLPVRLDMTLTEGIEVKPRLDVFALGWLGYGLADRRLRLELGESFSSGAPVFQARDEAILSRGVTARGLTQMRTVFLSDPTRLSLSAVDREKTLAHERVHVLQSDFILTAWNDLVTDAVLRRLPRTGWLREYLSFDVVGWMLINFHDLVYGRGDWQSPVQLEARFLSHQ
jgi:hypothetical protein